MTSVALPETFERRRLDVPESLLAPLRPWWDRLPRDRYLKSGFRYRRHTSFRVTPDSIEARPQRPVFQLEEHNRLFGGMHREFELLEAEMVAHPAFQAIAHLFLDSLPVARDGLFLRVHQIRVVDTGDGGRPDPEGPHREGRLIVSFVPVTIQGVVPGPTRLYRDGDSEPFFDETLGEGDLLMMNDSKVLHTTAPFVRVTGEPAYRDILILSVVDDEANGTVL